MSVMFLIHVSLKMTAFPSVHLYSASDVLLLGLKQIDVCTKVFPDIDIETSQVKMVHRYGIQRVDPLSTLLR